MARSKQGVSGRKMQDPKRREDVKTACDMVANGDMSLTEAAAQVGFNRRTLHDYMIYFGYRSSGRGGTAHWSKPGTAAPTPLVPPAQTRISEMPKDDDEVDELTAAYRRLDRATDLLRVANESLSRMAEAAAERDVLRAKLEEHAKCVERFARMEREIETLRADARWGREERARQDRHKRVESTRMFDREFAKLTLQVPGDKEQG